VLIINGHDLFNFFNRKYAVSIEEISNLVATSKIQFLEEHGFSMFKREGDRKLRNKIAHYDFVIDKDGTVKIEGLSINIFQKIKDLLDFTITVDETLASCFEETNEKKQIQELLKRKDLMLPKLTDQDLE
jgi:CHASE2 domain-containing sensor protein